MLVNRIVERLGRVGVRHRELRRRALEQRERRPPVVIVPPCFGVRLVDGDGRAIWGDTTRLFARTSFTDVDDLRPDGLVDGFAVLPRLYRHDVLGGLVRYLAAVGGYVPGEDLVVFGYDWRKDMATGARTLAGLLRRLRGAGDEAVDLIAISSGGLVARALLAGLGGAGDAAEACAGVRRVVYLGAPQRGSHSGVVYSQEGLSFLTGGKQFAALPLQRSCPGMFDMLPHPDDPVFVDRDGAPLGLDHLDPAVWRELGMVGADRAGLGDELARVRAMHRAFDAAAPHHPPSVVIAGRHLRTAARAVVVDGKVVLPCPACAGDVRAYPHAFADGDGAVPAATMAAAPGQGPDGPWWVTPRVHHRIATEPSIHPLVLEALLAPLRRVPRERYAWPRNPNVRIPDDAATPTA